MIYPAGNVETMRHLYRSFPDPKFIEPPPNDVLTEMAHKLAEDQLSKLELYPNISSAPDFFIKVPISLHMYINNYGTNWPLFFYYKTPKTDHVSSQNTAFSLPTELIVYLDRLRNDARPARHI